VKLYELSERYQRILDAIEDQEGELTEEQLTELLDVEGGFRSKVESVAKFIKSLTCDADAIKAERKRLADRKGTLDKRIEWLKRYLLEALRATDTTKVKGELLSVSRRKAPVSCEVVNTDEIPDEFKEEVIDVKVDKKAIITRFKVLGDAIPGVQLHTDHEYVLIQ